MRAIPLLFGLIAAAGCGGPAFEEQAVRAACDTVIRKYHQAVLDGDLEAIKQCLGANQLAELEAADSEKNELALQLMRDTAPESLTWGGMSYVWKPEHYKGIQVPPSVDDSRGLVSATYKGPNADGDTVAYHLWLFPEDAKGRIWKIFKLTVQVMMKVEE